MSSINILNSSYSSSTSSASSYFSDSITGTTETTYNEDAVTLSEEALELLEELRYKENLDYVKTENDVQFDRVSKALPNTEGFADMLLWLSKQSEAGETFIIGEDESVVNRNVYEKDPILYAEMWSNMYENFTDLMGTLGLEGDEASQRELLDAEEATEPLMERLALSFTSDTRELLTYFNITV